uniref:Putative 6-Pyruvoyl tetrahydrobiopterin synthase n=1 Tax=viral metagenome TaxID=1070528 RepID=A0A6M3LK89_9ZZZZ
MYKLQKTYSFSSAHHLKDTKSLVSKKCLKNHGHEWHIKVEIITKELVDDMVVDFGRIKDIINLLDHKDLNEVLTFNPTAENIAGFLHATIGTHIEVKHKLKVTVEESPGAKVTYWE